MGQRFVFEVGLDGFHIEVSQGCFQVQFWIFNGERFGEPGKGSLPSHGPQTRFRLIPESKRETYLLAGSEVGSSDENIGKVVNSFLTGQGQRVAQTNPTLLYFELFNEYLYWEWEIGLRGVFASWFFGSLAARLGRCLFLLGGGGDKVQRYHRFVKEQGVHHDFFREQRKN